MRPRNFEEYIGQEHLVGPGRVLRRAIESDQLPSIIFWGPPGSGKTTLACVIATLTKSHFSMVSAVSAGVADLRRIVEEARERRKLYRQRTILFIDEIHRFSKSQQDAVLPYVEDGTVILIGATTENPSFEVISPLLSRARVFTLKALEEEQLRAIIERALADGERGLGKYNVQLPEEALKQLIIMSNGDARVALNALELATLATRPDAQGQRLIDLPTIEDALQHRALIYDQGGDQHYDTISAFIKSIRGSDADAGLYWLARMLEAGEDPLFIARRLVILAAEDVGLADPHALPLAVAAQQAVHFIGMPEGFFPLAEAVIYLATAPKSNSILTAYSQAREDVKKSQHEPVPLHLRNPVTRFMKAQGYGKDYKYDHGYEGHYSGQQHLPDSLKNRRYYQPGDQGFEREIRERLRRLRESQPPQEQP